MKFKKLLNGKYYIYQIEDGGCGIVKADDEVDAVIKVKESYVLHGQPDICEEDIEVHLINYDTCSVFLDTPDVIELGMRIDLA